MKINNQRYKVVKKIKLSDYLLAMGVLSTGSLFLFTLIFVNRNSIFVIAKRTITVKGHEGEAVIINYGTRCEVDNECPGKASRRNYTKCCNKKTCCSEQEYMRLNESCSEVNPCPDRFDCQSDKKASGLKFCRLEVQLSEATDDSNATWLLVLMCVLIILFVSVGISVGVVLCCCLRCGPCKDRDNRSGLCLESKRNSKSTPKTERDRKQRDSKTEVPDNNRKGKENTGAKSKLSRRPKSLPHKRLGKKGNDKNNLKTVGGNKDNQLTPDYGTRTYLSRSYMSSIGDNSSYVTEDTFY